MFTGGPWKYYTEYRLYVQFDAISLNAIERFW